ncbi:hypothetical protein ACWCOP_09385 [Maricaulaceae bacterium MS644]
MAGCETSLSSTAAPTGVQPPPRPCIHLDPNVCGLGQSPFTEPEIMQRRLAGRL